MRIRKYDALILTGIGRSITASRQPAVRRRQSCAVRIDYREWLGKQTTVSERACLSRALTLLERRGYLVRLPGKCVALTFEGMRYLYDLETVELPDATEREPLENGIGTPTSGSPPTYQDVSLLFANGTRLGSYHKKRKGDDRQ